MDILKSHADLSAEQITYLDSYTIEIDTEQAEYNTPEEDDAAEDLERKQDEMVVAGKTTFADLLDWGMPVDHIEAIIGGEFPNRLMLVRDYCTENGRSFWMIKTELQAQADKLE